MNIGIVGGGAIGLLIASKLSEQGHQVNIYVRNKVQKKLINEYNLLSLPSQKTYSVKAELIEEIKPDELMFICVKQYDLNNDVFDYLKALPSTLVFLQNGMGHIDLIKAANLHHTIFIGTCEHAARKKDERSVEHTGKGKINLALYQGDNQLLSKYVDALSNEAFPIKIESDWKKMLLDKLLINSVVNPITAVNRVKNGALITDPNLNQVAQNLTFEVALALSLDPIQQWERVQSIATLTGDNDSSMKVDLDKGRKTEVDGILGYVQRHAIASTPIIDHYVKAIKKMEKGEEG